MSDLPRFGQYAQTERAEMCPRHPDKRAVGYCKRCNRPTCVECTVPTEVGSVCVECASTNRRRRFMGGNSTPVVTYTFLALSVAVYLLQWVAPAIPQALSFNPILASYEPWRFVTAGFVHYGFMHLLFNMLMLYILGAAVEKAAGHWRYASLYLLSAFGGSVAILAWALVDNSTLAIVTVGASGALYGMFGAVFVQQKRAGISTTSILVLLAINLAYSFWNSSTVSWQAHVGGLLIGGLVAWMYLALAEPKAGKTARAQGRAAVFGTIGVTAALILVSIALYYPVWPIISSVVS